jgi:RNA polymerase sigma factor
MSQNHAGDKLSVTLMEIRQGNSQARDIFLEEYKPFIAKVASNLCKRFLDWGRDDELSIGLIALNSAIERYNPEKGVPFLPFARLVIESNIKDHFKKEARHQHASFYTPADGEQEELFSTGEQQQAWENYQNLTIEDERQQEIEAFDLFLRDYGIQFEDLVEASPKHKDTRQTMHRAAYCLASDPTYMAYLTGKKMLPTKELALVTGIHRKTIEKGRKYIIALAIILYYREEFIYLRSYISPNV